MRQSIYILLLLFIFNGSYAQNVEVLGQLKIVNGTQGIDKVLTSDGAGNTSWKTPTQILISQQKSIKGGIQRLLDWGVDPLTLWQNGIRADSIFGKIVNPGGGLTVSYWPTYIYYIDTLDLYPTWKWLGAIQFNSPYTSGGNRVWGCSGTAIAGANGENFLDGIQNTIDRLAGCSALSAFSDIGPTGFSMASKADAALIIQNAVVIGTWNLTYPTTPHWTSTEATGADEATKVWTITNTGTLALTLKTATSCGLAFKAFNTLL